MKKGKNKNHINTDQSIEFNIQGDICLAKILDTSIEEDSQRANSRGAYDFLISAQTSVNIIDFVNVAYTNSGSWPRFVWLLSELLKQGRVMRIARLKDQPLKKFFANKFDTIIPRYPTLISAKSGKGFLNPVDAEATQRQAIERLSTKQTKGE